MLSDLGPELKQPVPFPEKPSIKISEYFEHDFNENGLKSIEQNPEHMSIVE